MRKRCLNGVGKEWCQLYRAETKYIQDIYSGYLSLIHIDKVNRRLAFQTENGELCLGDDGFKWLTFLPDKSNWCMTAMYNHCNEIIEWYFDITKKNGIDEQGNPYQDDLFLDVVLSPSNEILILDEDELQDALNQGEVTDGEYRMAYSVCEKLIQEFISVENAVSTFCARCLEQFTS